MTICPKCKDKVFHNQGISTKNGQPYENYKCGNKGCDFIQWVDLKQPREARETAGKGPNWDEIRARKEEGMEWLNAKNNAAILVAAAIRSGQLQLEDYEETFKKVTTGIFNFQEPNNV